MLPKSVHTLWRAPGAPGEVFDRVMGGIFLQLFSERWTPRVSGGEGSGGVEGGRASASSPKGPALLCTRLCSRAAADAPVLENVRILCAHNQRSRVSANENPRTIVLKMSARERTESVGDSAASRDVAATVASNDWHGMHAD